MAPLLKINGRDLSEYLQVAEELELDPEHEAPQFAGTPALREGEAFTADAVSNREWVFPLLLSAGNRAGLHALVRAINGDLINGAEVQFATDASDPTTYFTLETGRLDVAYEFFLSVHATARATLNLWTSPRGSTGTQRMVASLRATGPVSFPATGILGDREALSNLEVRAGSGVASSGRVIGYGVHPHPSFNGIHSLIAGASQLEPQASSVIVGASVGIASRYVAIPISPTTASGVALRSYLTPADAHVGRHRVLGFMRSGLSGPITVHARDRWGAPLGATAQATQVDVAKMQIVDLGEINVQGRASSQEPAPTQYVELIAAGASGHTINASPALALTGLLYLPIGRTGLLRTAGGEGDLFIAGDTFDRLGISATLEGYPQAQGAAWNNLLGEIGRGGLPGEGNTGPGFPGKVQAVNPVSQDLAANASGLAAIASGQERSDVQVEAKVSLAGGVSPGAASAAVTLYPLAFYGGGLFLGQGAKLQLGPSQTLQIVHEDLLGASVVASAGIATTLASGLYTGQEHKLIARKLGPRIDVWIGTAPAGSPALSASNAGFQNFGHPHVRMNSGSNVASSTIAIDDFRFTVAGASTLDMGPRESFRFESHPEERAVQANASVYTADRTAEFRGRPPRLPPVGSPGATGPARVVVFQGEVDNFQGQDVIDVNLTALERFSFLR